MLCLLIHFASVLLLISSFFSLPSFPSVTDTTAMAVKRRRCGGAAPLLTSLLQVLVLLLLISLSPAQTSSEYCPPSESAAGSCTSGPQVLVVSPQYGAILSAPSGLNSVSFCFTFPPPFDDPSSSSSSAAWPLPPSLLRLRLRFSEVQGAALLPLDATVLCPLRLTLPHRGTYGGVVEIVVEETGEAVGPPPTYLFFDLRDEEEESESDGPMTTTAAVSRRQVRT